MAETSGGCEQSRERVWEALERVAPPGEAVALFELFFAFARALQANAQGALGWRPGAGPCRDERLALGMIEASQRADRVGLLDAASQLLGADGLGDALQAAQRLASTLTRRGILLCPKRPGEPCPADLCPHRRLH